MGKRFLALIAISMCHAYRSLGVRRSFFKRMRPVAFAGHAGTALTSLRVLGPSQVRMVLANPTETEAVRTVRIGIRHGAWTSGPAPTPLSPNRCRPEPSLVG